jgi:hypothetical protein
MMSRAQRIESVTGFREPAAKGAIVRGMRPTETALGGVSYVCNWTMACSVEEDAGVVDPCLPPHGSSGCTYLSKLQW